MTTISTYDKAKADYLAKQIAKQIRAVLVEDRRIRNRSNIQGYIHVEPEPEPDETYNTPYDN